MPTLPETKCQRILRILAICVILFIFLMPVFGFLRYGMMMRPKCETETLKRVENLSGYDFEVRETLCRGFVSTDEVEVFVRDPRSKETTRLFNYNPPGVTRIIWDGPMHYQFVYPWRAEDWIPTITAVDANHVQIAVAHIQEAYGHLDKWRDLMIEYNIGQIHEFDHLEVEEAPTK